MQPSDPNFQASQNAELRSVPLPGGLLQRLRRSVMVDDDGLDAALCEVEIPAGLADRLRSVPLADDAGLDEAIRDVRQPVGVQQRLRRIPKHWIRLTKAAHWATAASLLIAIGLSYVGAMVAFLWVTYQPGQVSRPKLASTTVELREPARESLDFSMAALPGVEPDGDMVGGLPTVVPEFELLSLDNPGSLPPLQRPGLFYPWNSVDPMMDSRAYRWGVFGAPNLFDDEPEWKKAPPFVVRGIRTPALSGYPLAFETKYGVHSFVSPVASELQTSVVPLGIDTASYELTQRYLQDGRLPPPAWLRTEEFLAAIDYDFPRPRKDAMAVEVVGGPTPFGRGVLLMQVGVQAGEIRSGKRPPVHLTLVVDTSASMQTGGRLTMVRRALGKLVQRLQPQDRLSLIAFSAYPHVVFEDVSCDQIEHLVKGIATLRPQSSTNVPAGLSMAYAIAERTAGNGDAANCVVLLTDGIAELDYDTCQRIEQHLIEAAAKGLVLHMLDLMPEETVPEETSTPPDFQWASFARAGMGEVHRADSADRIGWVLREIISGQSQMIAAEARLKVSFNPKVVMLYRLLGHEANNVMEARPEADFYSGQSATALYEIQLKLTDSGEVVSGDVATAELSWRDARGNQHHHASRKIHSKQFSSNLADAPLSLQAAAVVSETAKVLRRSPFTPQWPKPVSPLGQVLKMAEQLDSRLMQQPTFAEFISLVEQAEKARP